MKCSFPGCDKENSAFGLCHGHRRQQKAGEEVRALRTQYRGLSEYDRFFKWVDVKGASDCWNWIGGKVSRTQYGQFRNAQGVGERAHRAAWRILKGETPSQNVCVLHRCDNPSCCNPLHLFLGSHADNNKDMRMKNRANLGEKHGRSKLTAELVRDIRSSNLSGVEIARRLGITPTTVCDVRVRKTWKHIV